MTFRKKIHKVCQDKDSKANSNGSYFVAVRQLGMLNCRWFCIFYHWGTPLYSYCHFLKQLNSMVSLIKIRLLYIVNFSFTSCMYLLLFWLSKYDCCKIWRMHIWPFYIDMTCCHCNNFYFTNMTVVKLCVNFMCFYNENYFTYKLWSLANFLHSQFYLFVLNFTHNLTFIISSL